MTAPIQRQVGSTIYTEYVVKSTDKDLKQIAKDQLGDESQYTKIRRWDNNLPKDVNINNPIVAGWTLLLPPKPVTKPKTHTVKSGDKLGELAKTYGTTVAKIVADNKVKYPKINTPVGKYPDGFIDIGWILDIK